MLTGEFSLEEALKVREEEVTDKITKEVTEKNLDEFRKLLKQAYQKKRFLSS
jgi:galactokinase/mevalonate kinase-like predicted kinase